MNLPPTSDAGPALPGTDRPPGPGTGEATVPELQREIERLQQRLERHERALELAGETLWDWQLPQRRVHNSRSRAQLLGYEQGELASDLATWLSLVHPDDVAPTWEAAVRYFKGQAPRFEVEYRQRHKQGHWLWVRSRGEAVERDAQGRVVRMLGTVVDITGRRQLEDQVVAMAREREASLQEALRKSEELVQAKTQFLATMAHEIRTPLNSVIGGTSLALMEQDAQRQRESLQLVDSAARHLLQLVNHVLDFSRIEAGEVPLEEALLSMRHLLHTLSVHFAGALQAKGLQWRTHIDPAIPALLLGDGTRLLQVLTNLVGNAVKFTDHGHVSVDMRLLDLSASVARLRVSVSDSGIGMDAEQRARLFTAFGQADRSIARRFGGTGLGLVISRRIMALMGGTLDVVSTPGQGSRFILEWPARVAEARDGAPPAGPVDPVQRGRTMAEQLAEAGAALAGRRVLAVDDNRMNLVIVRRLLERAGLRVDEVLSGPLALQALSAQDYDAVLMDLYMPEMTGAECAQAIRQDLGRQALPIIALSASVTQEERALCLASGMNDFVPKPVDPLALLSALRRHVLAAADGADPPVDAAT